VSHWHAGSAADAAAGKQKNGKVNWQKKFEKKACGKFCACKRLLGRLDEALQ
jgi:hypothetical protein